MPKKMPEATTPPRERAFLVGVELASREHLLTLDDSLAELALLADTAGIDVVGQTSQKLRIPHTRTYIGSGKVEEVRILVEETQADIVLFDDELSPRHQRELEKIFEPKCRIIDRTALILEIFSQHARTREGSLQVELAQYEYRLPRLTRAWTHLARQAGGGGGRTGSVGGVGLRGPGETQLEVDRREIHRRIDHLKEELGKVRLHRSRHRSKRKQSGVPILALVGYTNAGKSTLLNRLANAGVFVADKLFATLDPTTRRVALPGGHLALMTDTVGFIQKLPTDLVAAFRATLEEIAEADLLLHVIDITHPNVLAHAQAVHETLAAIGAEHVPILTILNKIDRLGSPQQAAQSLAAFESAAAISALTGQGVDVLLEMISEMLFEKFVPVHLKIPHREGNLIALMHKHGQVERVQHERSNVIISGRLPMRLLAQYTPFIDHTERDEVKSA